MLYSLYQATWRIISKGRVEVKISLHSDYEDFVAFLAEERRKNPRASIAIQDKGCVTHSNANLDLEIKNAKLLDNQYGVWKIAGELALQ